MIQGTLLPNGNKRREIINYPSPRNLRGDRLFFATGIFDYFDYTCASVSWRNVSLSLEQRSFPSREKTLPSYMYIPWKHFREILISVRRCLRLTQVHLFSREINRLWEWGESRTTRKFQCSGGGSARSREWGQGPPVSPLCLKRYIILSCTYLAESNEINKIDKSEFKHNFKHIGQQSVGNEKFGLKENFTSVLKYISQANDAIAQWVQE